MGWCRPMRNNRTSQLTLLALLTALSLALGFVNIPTPTGFLTLLDTGIFFTAFYLGSRSGAVVGGLSAFLLDYLLGYPQYMIFSLLAHGLQGYFAGWTGARRYIGVVLASLAMVGIYILAALILGFGWGAALAGIWGNLCQNLLGLLLGAIFYRAFNKAFPRKGGS